jgi:transcriptional regulator with XRE-family HTH domain
VNYGEKFKYVRELRQLTLSDLSKLCDLSIPYLSDIENGKKRPAMKSLERIAKALNADTHFFMNDAAVSLNELTKISGYDPPPDIVEFFSRPESLAYAVLARDLHEQQVDPIFLKELLESIKKMKSK